MGYFGSVPGEDNHSIIHFDTADAMSGLLLAHSNPRDWQRCQVSEPDAPLAAKPKITAGLDDWGWVDTLNRVSDIASFNRVSVPLLT